MPGPVRQSLKEAARSAVAAGHVPGAPVGHIDGARWTEDGSLVVVGWALPARAENIFIVADGGGSIAAAEAIQVPRPDLLNRFGEEFGPTAAAGGFLARFRNVAKPGKVSLAAEGRRTLFSARAIEAGSDPVAHARWLFSQPTPVHQLVERFSTVDLPAISSVIEKRNRALEHKKIERWDFGRPRPDPQATVIVPLYGRWDFVEHQLLAFADDREFNEDIELVYVIDDPDLLAGLLSSAEELYELYNVPFTVIWGHANRGFSGANNLGANAASGRYLVFLNSDAFPTAPGWVGSLVRVLEENPEFGVVAPRLLFPDGGLQHVGIEFRWNGAFGIWINDHPLLGLPAEADKVSGLCERHAVTGACMAVRRDEFDALDGFDTGYLIGDFEDSDLCLKYRRKGLLPGYFPGVELTHLERQSIKQSGDQEFRQKVTILNAVRHQLRWGELIETLVADEMREAAQ